jgi:hypothetical protein
MLLIRDIMFCKPGQARPMVEKFLSLNKVGRPMGLPPMRVMTDLSAERYWMVVAELEVEDMQKYSEIMQKAMSAPELQEAMKGYHDLVVQGRREIYTIES